MGYPHAIRWLLTVFPRLPLALANCFVVPASSVGMMDSWFSHENLQAGYNDGGSGT